MCVWPILSVKYITESQSKDKGYYYWVILDECLCFEWRERRREYCI